MRTDVCTDSLLPVALVATGFARTLVRQLRTLFDCAEWQSGKLESARKSLENARSIRQTQDLSARREGSRNFPTYRHLSDSALRNARRDVDGWRSVFGSAELRLSRTLAGIDAALDGMTERGCRSVLKRLIDDHEPTRFTGCEPTAWEVFPAAHLARSVLFRFRDFADTKPPAVEAGEAEETNIESELNLGGHAVESVLRILVSVAELDRLDAELRRDQTALAVMADESEPNDDLQSLECCRAELVCGGATWPGGSVVRLPAKIAGQSPEGASFQREILKRAVPHLRALGADLDATTPMNISTWLVEWLSARPDAATLPGDPFKFFAEGFRRFAAEFRESVRPAETTEEKTDVGGDDTKDGPVGIDQFRWKGTLHTVKRGQPFHLLKAAWESRFRTLSEDGIRDVMDDSIPSWSAVKTAYSRANNAYEEAGLPLRFTGDGKLFTIKLVDE